jgi:hypothetical protein
MSFLKHVLFTAHCARSTTTNAVFCPFLHFFSGKALAFDQGMRDEIFRGKSGGDR